MGALRMGLTEVELPNIVARWRAANPNIVRLWSEIEEAALGCVQACVTTTAGYGRLEFSMEMVGQVPALTMQLPSGRKLFYLEPTVLNGGKFKRPSLHYLDTLAGGKQILTPTFGGKLAENAVQSLARDCLCTTLTRLKDTGYNVVFHVHDEVVIEAPADADLQPVLDIMALPVPWAPGLLLRGAGFKTTDFYMKD